jgi:hypothetical protein
MNSVSKSAALRGKPERHALILLQILCLGLLFATQVPTLTAQTQWHHKGPHARSNHSAVYDQGSGRMIIFAGQHVKNFPNESDVWWGIYSSGSTELNWLPAMPTGKGPAARFGHSAVLDSGNNRMVVFGGGKGTNAPAPCLNDVWVLTNANGVSATTPVWTQQTPSGTPPSPRFAHTAVYDANTNNMTIFGGYDCNSTYFNDVWVLSNANGLTGTPTWTQLFPTGTPPTGREGATGVYDPSNNLMIVFGGDSGTPVYQDVWVLSYANGTGGTPAWTELFPSGTPPAARSGQSAIYDAADNIMTIYGGQISNSTSGLLNDFWVLSNANGVGGTPSWTQLLPQTAGAFRSFHTAVYDSSQNVMLIFGGNTNVQLLPKDDHITILTDANGLPEKKSLSTSPTQRK